MADLYTRPQAKSGSIGRGLSPNLWHQAPLTQVLTGGLGEGFGFIDDSWHLTMPAIAGY